MIFSRVVLVLSLLLVVASVRAQMNPYERLLNPIALSRLDNPDFGPLRLTYGMGFGTRPDPDNPGYYIYAEDTGTGILTHFFVTARTPDSLTMFRIYIDGKLKEEKTLSKLFAQVSGILRPPFDTTIGEARLCDVQLPYTKGFKISYRTPELYTWYDYGWRPLGSSVDLPDSARLSTWQAQAEQVYRDPAKRPIAAGEDTTIAMHIPTADSGMLQLTGAAIITLLNLRVDRYDASLDSVWLRVYWDDELAPSIETPLTALFGQNLRFPDLRSFALEFSRQEGLTLNLPMPFARSAKFVLVNHSSQAIAPTLLVRRILAADTKGLGYLHARFAEAKPTLYGIPHHVFRATGRGRFVGLLMGVRDLKRLQSYEGDAIFTIDDDPAYSFHYEGTEDYFNGAQYFSNGAFQSPFGGATDPIASFYRFHYMDAIDFRTSIVFGFQHGTGDNAHEHYLTLPFWYQMHIPFTLDLDTLSEAMSMLRARGTGYQPHERVIVRLDSRQIAESEATADGRFMLPIDLIGTRSGTHTLDVNGVQHPAPIVYFDLRTLQLSERRKLQIQVGDTLSVTGLGYSKDDALVFRVGTERPSSRYSIDTQGRMSGFIVVPNITAGTYTIGIDGFDVEALPVITIAKTLRYEAEDLGPDSLYFNVSLLYTEDYSQNAVLQFRPRGEGDSIRLNFRVPFSGEFESNLAATHGRAFGNFVLALDDVALPFAGYADKDLGKPDSVAIGTLNLTEGEHHLTLKYISRDSRTYDSVIWIDYLELRDSRFGSHVPELSVYHPTIHPNPATDVIRVDHVSELSDIEVVDVLGRSYTVGRSGDKIIVRALPRGLYWLMINGAISGRFLLE